MPEKLIHIYTMKLTTPECFPQAEWYRASAHLQADITEVLPYLHAELKGSEYDHGAGILLWNSDEKKYAFRPDEIAVVPVESREEAHLLVNRIVSRVNDIWIRRGEITPDFSGKKPLPNVLDIYRLLPGTNCNKCGLTCMAFAAALRNDPGKLSLCPYLSEQDFRNLTL